MERVAAGVAAAVLLGLAITYWFTYEPAFALTVRWRDGLTWDRRLELERQLGLVRHRDQQRRTITYDLVDTRSTNVRALLTHPDVEDASPLDAATFSVPADAPYGTGWMWAGSRSPAIRAHRLTPVLVAVALITLGWWCRRELRRRRVRWLRLAGRVVAVRRRIEHAGQ
jgi:hypothetical protein